VKLHVDVTKADIARGVHGALCCPVALACNRAAKAAGSDDRFSVTSVSCRRRRDNARAPLPEPARDFVARFDCDDRVAPLSFELEFPGDQTEPQTEARP
jgi:hypothetical protein